MKKARKVVSATKRAFAIFFVWLARHTLARQLNSTTPRRSFPTMMATTSQPVNDNSKLCQDPKRSRLPDEKLCPVAITLQGIERQRQLTELRRMIAEHEQRSGVTR